MDREYVILFDGDCNFCNSAVNFIIQRERQPLFRFAPLQSDIGKKILRDYSVTDSGSTIVFIERGRVYFKSTAALRICRYLNKSWSLMIGFIIVPVFIRDAIYSWISRNRQKLMKNRNSCRMPSASLRSKFLNESL